MILEQIEGDVGVVRNAESPRQSQEGAHRELLNQ